MATSDEALRYRPDGTCVAGTSRHIAPLRCRGDGEGGMLNLRPVCPPVRAADADVGVRRGREGLCLDVKFQNPR